MSQDQNNTLTAVTQTIETVSNQLPADALTLKFWQDRHRGQCNRRYRRIRGLDGHFTEENVSDDLPVAFRHEGGKHRAVSS